MRPCRRRLRETGSTSVHQYQPRKARQARKETGERGIEPCVFDVGEEAADEHKVVGPFTSRLIRQRYSTVAGVPHIRAHHLTASPVLDRAHPKRKRNASDRSERAARPAVSPLAGLTPGLPETGRIGLV